MVKKIITYLQKHQVEKKIFLTLLIITTVVSIFSSQMTTVNAAVHSRVVIAPMMDTNSDSVVIEVVEEENKWRVSDKWNGNTTLNGSYYCGDGDLEQHACAYLNFPGQSYKYEEGITSKDEALATNVGSVMEDSISTLVSFVEKNKSKSSSFTLENLLKNLLANVKDGPDGTLIGGTFEIGDIPITIAPLSSMTGEPGIKEIETPAKRAKYTISDGPGKGTTIDNYAIVYTGSISGDGEYAIFQWAVPKGYAAGQYAEGEWNTEDTDQKNVSYISLYGVAAYAVFVKDTHGIVLGDSAYNAIYGESNNIITKAIGSGLTWMLKGVYSALNIDDVVDLVFSRGGRAVSYYYGVMPWKWLDVSQVLYWISLVIAGFMLFYQIYLLIAKRAMADISPVVRADMKDSFLNVGIAIFFQIIYIPFFGLLCRTNGLIVEMFSSLVRAGANTFDLGYHAFGALIISMVSLGLTISMNIKYIIRSLTVTLAYATGPIFISSIAIDNRKHLFSIWLKELISSIFLQSFNAIILAFLFMVTTGQRGITRLILLYAFIPLNKWYRESLWGVRNGAMGAADETERKANLGGKARGALMGAATAGLAFDEAAGTNMFGKGLPPGAVKKTKTGDQKSSDPAAEKNALKQIGTAKKDGTLAHPRVQFAGRKALAMTAAGAAGAAGLPAAPLLGRAMATRMASPLARMQEAYKKGYSSLQDGFIHRNEKGEIDGYASTKKELQDRFKDKPGTIEKGQFGVVDQNKIDNDTWNALQQTGADKNADGEQKFFTDEKTGMRVVAGTSASNMMDMNKAGLSAKSEIEKYRNAGYAGMKEQGWFKPNEDGTPGGTYISNKDYNALSPEDKAQYQRVYKSALDQSFLSEGTDENGFKNLSEKGAALEEGINNRGMDPGSFLMRDASGAAMISRADENGSQNVPNANTISGNVLAEQRKDAANMAKDLKNAGYAGTSTGIMGRFDKDGKLETMSRAQYEKMSDEEKAQLRNDGWNQMTVKDIDKTIADNKQAMGAIEHAMNKNDDYGGARVIETADGGKAIVQPAREDFTSRNHDLNNVVKNEMNSAKNDEGFGFGERTKGMMNAAGEFKSNAELATMSDAEKAEFNRHVVKSEIGSTFNKPEELGLLERAIDHGGADGTGAVTGVQFGKDENGKAFIIQDANKYGQTSDFKIGSQIQAQKTREAEEAARGFNPEGTKFGMVKENADGTYDFKSNAELAKMSADEKADYTMPATQRQIADRYASDPESMKTLGNAMASLGDEGGRGKISTDANGNAMLIQRTDLGNNVSKTDLGNVMDDYNLRTKNAAANGFNAGDVEYGKVATLADGTKDFKSNEELARMSDTDRAAYTQDAVSSGLAMDSVKTAALGRALDNNPQYDGSFLSQGADGSSRLIQATDGGVPSSSINPNAVADKQLGAEDVKKGLGYNPTATAESGYMRMGNDVSADGTVPPAFVSQSDYDKMSDADKAMYTPATSRPVDTAALSNENVLSRAIDSENASRAQNGQAPMEAQVFRDANGGLNIVQPVGAERFDAASAYRNQKASDSDLAAKGFQVGTLESGRMNEAGDFKTEAELAGMTPEQRSAYAYEGQRARVDNNMNNDYQMAAVEKSLEGGKIPGAYFSVGSDGHGYVAQRADSSNNMDLPDIKSAANNYASTAARAEAVDKAAEAGEWSRKSAMAGGTIPDSAEAGRIATFADGTRDFKTNAELAQVPASERAAYTQPATSVGINSDAVDVDTLSRGLNEHQGQYGGSFTAKGADGSDRMIVPDSAGVSMNMTPKQIENATIAEDASLKGMGFNVGGSASDSGSPQNYGSEGTQVGWAKVDEGGRPVFKTAEEYGRMSDAEKADYTQALSRPIDTEKVGDLNALDHGLAMNNAARMSAGETSGMSYLAKGDDGSARLIQTLNDNGEVSDINAAAMSAANSNVTKLMDDQGLDSSKPIQNGYMRTDGVNDGDFKTQAEYNRMSDAEKANYTPSLNIPLDMNKFSDSDIATLQRASETGNAARIANGQGADNSYIHVNDDGSASIIKAADNRDAVNPLQDLRAQKTDEAVASTEGYHGERVQGGFASRDSSGNISYKSPEEFNGMSNAEQANYAPVTSRPLNTTAPEYLDTLQRNINNSGVEGVGIVRNTDGSANLVQSAGAERFNANAAVAAQNAEDSKFNMMGYNAGTVEVGKTNADGEFRNNTQLAAMPEAERSAYTNDVTRAQMNDAIMGNETRRSRLESAVESGMFPGARIERGEDGSAYVMQTNKEAGANLPDLRNIGAVGKGYDMGSAAETVYRSNSGGGNGQEVISASAYDALQGGDKSTYSAATARRLESPEMADVLQRRMDMAAQRGSSEYDGVSIVKNADGTASIVQPANTPVLNAREEYNKQIAEDNALAGSGYLAGSVEFGRTNAAGEFRNNSELAAMPEAERAAFTNDVTRAKVDDNVTGNNFEMGVIKDAFDDNKFVGASMVTDPSGSTYVMQANKNGEASLPNLNEAFNTAETAHVTPSFAQQDSQASGGSYRSDADLTRSMMGLPPETSGSQNSTSIPLGRVESGTSQSYTEMPQHADYADVETRHSGSAPEINIPSGIGVGEAVSAAGTAASAPMAEAAAIAGGTAAGVSAAASGISQMAHQSHASQPETSETPSYRGSDYREASQPIGVSEQTYKPAEVMSQAPEMGGHGFANAETVSGMYLRNSEDGRATFVTPSQYSQMSDTEKSGSISSSPVTARQIDDTLSGNEAAMNTLERAFNGNGSAGGGAQIAHGGDGHMYVVQSEGSSTPANLNRVIESQRAADSHASTNGFIPEEMQTGRAAERADGSYDFKSNAELAQMSASERAEYTIPATSRPVAVQNEAQVDAFERSVNTYGSVNGSYVSRDADGNASLISTGSSDKVSVGRVADAQMNMDNTMRDYGYNPESVERGAVREYTDNDGNVRVDYKSASELAAMPAAERESYSMPVVRSEIASDIASNPASMHHASAALDNTDTARIYSEDGHAYVLQSVGAGESYKPVNVREAASVSASENYSAASAGFVPESVTEGRARYDAETGKYDFRSNAELQSMPASASAQYTEPATMKAIAPEYASNTEVMSKLESMASSGGFGVVNSGNGSASVIQMQPTDVSIGSADVNVKDIAQQVYGEMGFSGDYSGSTMYAQYGNDGHVAKVITPSEYSNLSEGEKSSYTKGTVREVADDYASTPAQAERLERAMDRSNSDSSYVTPAAFTTEARSTPAVFTPASSEPANVKEAVHKQALYDNGYDPDSSATSGYVARDDQGNFTGTPITRAAYSKLSDSEKKKYEAVRIRKLAEDMVATEDNSGNYFTTSSGGGNGAGLKDNSAKYYYTTSKDGKHFPFPNLRKNNKKK